MFLWDLLVFILGLSILIMVHELGHFLCAKAFNVYCHEFSIGMGPVVVKTQKGETQYSIRALPIGGFVSMAGEGVDEATNIKQNDGNEVIDADNQAETLVEEKPNIPYERTINGIAAWKRFIVIAAGVIMNFIFSFIFLFIYLLSTGMPDGDVRLIAEKDSIAYKAGITNEIRVNGIEIIHVSPDGSEDVFITMSDAYGVDSLNVYLTNSSNKIKEQKIENMNQCVVFRYLEDGENKLSNRVCRPFSTVTNQENNTQEYTSKDLFGIQIGEHLSSISAGKAFVEAGKMEWELGTLIFKSLGTLFTKEGFSQVSGVVGIFSVSKQFQQMGFGYYMYFLGFISVNLGVMNLLPIPGLDGSQLIVIGIEGVTRKKISNRIKAIINGVGLVFLLLLMGVIMIKDIIGLF